MRATWTRQTVGIALSAICALALGVTAGAQAPDPLVGTWKLDVAKSTYKPGPAPKSVTVVIERGRARASKWPSTSYRRRRRADEDGLHQPAGRQGRPGHRQSGLRHGCGHARRARQRAPSSTRRAARHAMTVKTSVSKDGKTMTATTYTGTDPKGQAMNNVVATTPSSKATGIAGTLNRDSPGDSHGWVSPGTVTVECPRLSPRARQR